METKSHPDLLSNIRAGVQPHAVQVLHQVAEPGAAAMLGAMHVQDQDKSIYSSKEKQPEIDERVIVIARGFRCLGYRDEAGIWRYDSDGAPIENVLNWTRNRRP